MIYLIGEFRKNKSGASSLALPTPKTLLSALGCFTAGNIYFALFFQGIPGTGEPGGLPSMGLHRVGHDSDLAAAAAAFFQERVFSTSTEKCVQIGLILCFTSQPIGFLTKPHLSV